MKNGMTKGWYKTDSRRGSITMGKFGRSKMTTRGIDGEGRHFVKRNWAIKQGGREEKGEYARVLEKRLVKERIRGGMVKEKSRQERGVSKGIEAQGSQGRGGRGVICGWGPLRENVQRKEGRPLCGERH